MFLFWVVWNRITSVGPEIFNIPNNYRGRVVVIFKPGCGEQLFKTNEGFDYVIPEDGILIVNKKLKTGIIEHKYQYVLESGLTEEIPLMDVRDFNDEWTTEKNKLEPPRDKLGVYHWGRTGSMGTGSMGEVEFQEFYISTYNELSEEFGYKYGKEFRNRIVEKLRQCK